MGRSLSEIIAALPADEQEAVEARYQDLKLEVEGPRELRQVTGKAQAEIASALNIKQPSVSQIERQTDMYLSTLRSYVKAVGSELESTVKLPKRPAHRIHHLGAVGPAMAARGPSRRKRGASSPRRRHG